MGKSKKALESAALLDPWLPAHLAELMEALDLIDRERLEYVTLHPVNHVKGS